MDSSSKSIPGNSDSHADNSSIVLPVTDLQDISFSDNGTLNSAQSNETVKASSPSSEKIPVNAGHLIPKNTSDSDQSSMERLLLTNSRAIGTSISETLNPATSDETDKLSVPYSSTEISISADNPVVEESFDFDQTSISLANSQEIGLSDKETPKSAMSDEKDKVSMLCPSEEGSVSADNPIVLNRVDIDQASVVPVTNSKNISLSVEETSPSSTGDGTDKVSMPCSSNESSNSADNPIEKNQASIVSVTNSPDNGVSVNETHNGMDKVSMGYSVKESPLSSDNPIADQSSIEPDVINSSHISVSVHSTVDSATNNETYNISIQSTKDCRVNSDNPVTMDPDQFSIKPHVTNSQHIGVSANSTLDSAASDGTENVSMPSSSHESLVGSDNRISKNGLNTDPSPTAPPVSSSHNIVGEEIFCDCQGSDSEDDFFSIRGDFSNASSRQGSIKGSPQLDELPDSKLNLHPTERERPVQLFRNSILPSIGETKVEELAPTEENSRLVDLFQDPFWSDQANNHDDMPSINKETKLIEFFKDSYRSRENASIHASDLPSNNRGSKSEHPICHLPLKQGTSTVPRENPRASRAQNAKQKNKARTSPCCFPNLSSKPWLQGQKKGE